MMQKRGFTLVEMIVAVGIVALLTIAVGQIFGTVSSLVGTGSAIAETDQMARAIQAQMRDDFNSLSNLRADEAFLAIRNRRIRVYLTPQDYEADLRDGRITDLSSIPVDDTNQPTRSVVRRLDELMFFATGGDQGTFASAQGPGANGTPVRAPAARIYYGHGLRPTLDTDFDPRNPPSDSNVPRRQYIPDGDFGQPAGDPDRNRFDQSREVQGRNTYATRWLLLRQPLLLYGGAATGPVQNGVSPEIDQRTVYAPYVRDLEVLNRLNSAPSGPFDGLDNSDDPEGWASDNQRPDARRLPWGQVDVCAQTIDKARAWLEAAASTTDGLPNVNSTAFDGGLLDTAPGDSSLGTKDAALWNSVAIYPNTDAGRFDNARRNSRGVRSAIAGMFTRYQAESEAPFVDRGDALVEGETAVDFSGRPRPDSVLMDLHAVLGERCSNFEVAWSEGKTWTVEDREVGIPPFERFLHRDDLIWHDIDFMRDGLGANNDLSDENEYVYPRTDQRYLSEVPPGERDRLLVEAGDTSEGFGAATGQTPFYDTSEFGDRALVNAAAPDEDDEYLAIFPFRLPTETGGYTNFPWPKPTLIRVRMTLHDSQYRLKEGREYEFVFRVDLK